MEEVKPWIHQTDRASEREIRAGMRMALHKPRASVNYSPFHTHKALVSLVIVISSKSFSSIARVQQIEKCQITYEKSFLLYGLE